MSGIRHFLDLIDIPPAELRAMIDAARAVTPTGCWPARRWR